MGQTPFLTDSAFCNACPLPTTGPEAASTCQWCIANYFSSDDPSSGLTCHTCIDGAACVENTTFARVNLTHGRWRLSPRSREISDCALVGLSEGVSDWSPCVGGSEAGSSGEGYCAAGHTGPRCAACLDPDHYFETKSARCKVCPDRGPLMAVCVCGAFLAALVLGGLGYVYTARPPRYQRTALRLHQLVVRATQLAIIPNLKILIAFYQSVVTVPSVYDVHLPKSYYDWTEHFNWAKLDWSEFVVPGSCLAGGPKGRMLLRGLAPLGLLAAVVIGSFLWEVGLHHVRRRDGPPPFKQGVLQALPLVLFLSFSMCVSISTGIFGAWGCESFADDSSVPTVQSYLRLQISFRCSDVDYSSPPHEELKRLGLAFVAIWPLGLPLFSLALLLPLRKAIQRNNRSSPLLQATAFLHKEYEAQYFWFEPLFLVQRITIAGYLQLIPASRGLVRILAGLLVSFVYLLVLLVAKPYKRLETDFLAMGSQFALVTIFMAAVYMNLFDAWVVNTSLETATRVMGVSSTDQIVATMIVFNLGVVGGFFCLLGNQAFRSESIDVIRVVKTARPPELHLKQNLTYHLFNSHVWSTGQDQAATIKRQLQLLLPSVKVFLDVRHAALRLAPRARA